MASGEDRSPDYGLHGNGHMTSGEDRSRDYGLHGNGHMTTRELLSSVCEHLSLRITPELINTSLQTEMQELVISQLLPLNFEPHGLTTPISVIVNLLVHCFLLNRELEEVKGQSTGTDCQYGEVKGQSGEAKGHFGEVKGQFREHSEEVATLHEDLRHLKELYDGVSKLLSYKFNTT